MTSFPSEVFPTGAQTYRLVVRASTSGKKQFVWEVLDDGSKSLCVQASKQTFRSLEDAYNAGQGAMEYWRAKAMRAQAKALLAPPAARKRANVRVSGPSGPMTSSIYSRG
jgi:hypothetical protein